MTIDWLNDCYEPWRIQFVFDHRTVYSTFFHDVESWYAVDDLGARFSIDTRHNLNILTTNYWCEWMGQITLCGGARGPWQDPSGRPLWSVLICEGSDCAYADAVRRPSGRRRSNQERMSQ